MLIKVTLVVRSCFKAKINGGNSQYTFTLFTQQTLFQMLFLFVTKNHLKIRFVRKTKRDTNFSINKIKTPLRYIR